ncbi:MAG TPA: SdpI family protein [Roseiflexaceae bacterium]
MRSKWMAPIGIVAMLIFGAFVYSRLPDQVPTHWNIYGQVDALTDRLQAVLLLPALTAGLWLLLLGLPRIDPLRASYAAFAGTYQLFVNTLVLFMAAIYVVTLGSALGWNINVPQMIGIGVGLLFMVLGNEMGRLKPNWFAGIRTPWTLSDPEIWRRTHRFGGRVFFAAGLLIAVANLLLPATTSTFVILTGVLGASILSVGYSYLLWRQRSGA